MNPDNYGSLPACKKLAEVLARKGIAVETEFYWVLYPTEADYVLGDKSSVLLSIRHYPAYSMPEVWREVPWQYDGKLISLFKTKDGRNYCPSHTELQNTNPADALIELWAWVLEQEEKDGQGTA